MCRLRGFREDRWRAGLQRYEWLFGRGSRRARGASAAPQESGSGGSAGSGGSGGVDSSAGSGGPTAMQAPTAPLESTARRVWEEPAVRWARRIEWLFGCWDRRFCRRRRLRGQQRQRTASADSGSGLGWVSRETCSGGPTRRPATNLAPPMVSPSIRTARHADPAAAHRLELVPDRRRYLPRRFASGSSCASPIGQALHLSRGRRGLHEPRVLQLQSRERQQRDLRRRADRARLHAAA